MVAALLRLGVHARSRFAAAAGAAAIGTVTAGAIMQRPPRPCLCRGEGVEHMAAAPAGPVGPKSPTELIFDTLGRQRAVYLCGYIDDTCAKHIVAQLLVLEHTNPGAPITMYITSSGGQVWSGLGILDTMAFITAPVTTVVVGHASSMAAIIGTAGEPGCRFALPHSRIMVHEPRTTAGRDLRATDLEVSATQLKLSRQLTIKLLAKNTRKSEVDIEKLLDRDCYCTPGEAVELGLVDHVVTRIGELRKLAPSAPKVVSASATTKTASVQAPTSAAVTEDAGPAVGESSNSKGTALPTEPAAPEPTKPSEPTGPRRSKNKPN